MNFFKKPLIKEAIALCIIVYVLNKIGVNLGLYLGDSPIKEYDSILHFLAGVTTSLGVLWFYFYSGLFSANASYKNLFTIGILGIIFVGLSWEIYELLSGLMNFNMVGYGYDTTLDIIFDILGTVVACIYAYNQELKWKTIKQINLDSHFTAESALQPEQI